MGLETARKFAAALTLLHRQEADPVDPAGLVGADVAALVRLQEVRHESAQWARLNAVP